MWRKNICLQEYMETNCLQEYVKFELPPNQPITVSIGVDVKDIPKVSLNFHWKTSQECETAMTSQY